MAGVEIFIWKLGFYIINPLILLLFAAALVVFLWGVAQFIWNLQEGKVKEGATSKFGEGKKHMLWGVIGMFLMFSAIAILRVLGNTFGFDLPT